MATTQEGAPVETVAPPVAEANVRTSPSSQGMDGTGEGQPARVTALVRLQAVWRGHAVYRDAKRARQEGLGQAHVWGMQDVEDMAVDEGLTLAPPIVSILGLQRALNDGLLTDKVASMWWGFVYRRNLRAARSVGAHARFAMHLKAKLLTTPHVFVMSDRGGVSELRITNGRDAAAASREALRITLREVAEEEEARRERARVARDAASVAVAEELLEEIVLVDMLRIVHHAHEAVGRAGYKDAMDWLDPRARGRKFSVATERKYQQVLKQAKRAAASSGVVTPSATHTQGNVFVELPTWSVKDRARSMRGGGFVHGMSERDGNVQLVRRSESLFGDSRVKPLIETPPQPLADAQPWWVHLEKISIGGSEAARTHRLRTQSGRPRRDECATPDSLDTPPESPSPTCGSLSRFPQQLEPTLSLVERRMRQFTEAGVELEPSDLLSVKSSETRIDFGVAEASFGTEASFSYRPRDVRQMVGTTSPSKSPHLSGSTHEHHFTRHQKYMNAVRHEDGYDDKGDQFSKATPDDCMRPSTSDASHGLLASVGSATASRGMNNRPTQRGWCDRSRLLSSHRRVKERQVTKVDANVRKPCAGWGWGARPPTAEVVASSCSLPILGDKCAKALVDVKRAIVSPSAPYRPATAHVTTFGAAHPRFSAAKRGRVSTTAQIGQSWWSPAKQTMTALHGISTQRAATAVPKCATPDKQSSLKDDLFPAPSMVKIGGSCIDNVCGGSPIPLEDDFILGGQPAGREHLMRQGDHML